MPLIILRSPKGWTGPKIVNGKEIKSTFGNDGFRSYYTLGSSNPNGVGIRIDDIDSGNPYVPVYDEKDQKTNLYLAIIATFEDPFVRTQLF